MMFGCLYSTPMKIKTEKGNKKASPAKKIFKKAVHPTYSINHRPNKEPQ